MKWVVFGIAVAAVIPFGLLLRRARKLWPWLWTLVGFLPFFGLDSVDINLISYEHYRGDSKGIEITLIDLLVCALFFTLRKRRHPAPFRSPRYLYFLLVVLSLLSAHSALFASFSVWKLARMYLVVAIVARACEDVTVPPAILRGMALGVMYQLPLVLYQRYIQHVGQAPGSFPHQNSLGMALNLVLPVTLALVLTRKSAWLALGALGAGALSLVMTLSRGALVAFVVGSGFLYLISVYRKFTPRKMAVALLAVLAGGAVLIKAGDTLVERFLTAPKASAEARVRFSSAAAMMLEDHPLGIGINQYSLTLERRGYANRAGITGHDRSGIVHNIYWLTAAELGYPGLLVFLALLLLPLFAAFRAARRFGDDPRADVLLGLAVGLMVMYAQGFLEWAWRQTALSYLFWIAIALIGALVRQAPHARSRAG